MGISACFSFVRRKMARLRKTKLAAVLLLVLILIGFTGIIDLFYTVHYHSPNLTLSVLPPAIEPYIGKKEFFLLAIITSRPTSKSARQAIRQTWGSLHRDGTTLVKTITYK